MTVIKFDADITARKTSIDWWNSLDEDKRKALVAEHEVMLLTGQTIQQMFSLQQEAVIEKVYTKAELLAIIDIYENRGIGEDYKEFKQYLIDTL